MVKSTEFFDRLIERLDQLDSASLQGYLIKLMREKGLLETIFQTVREGVLIIDREQNIHFVNTAAMRLLGLPTDIEERDDPRLSRYLRDLNLGKLVSENPEEWDRASRQVLEVFYPEHRFLQFYLLPYRDKLANDASRDLVAIVLQDITDLQKDAESTIEQEKMNALTMLAAGVAHEIGNPLNSLVIHLQLLQRLFKKNPTNPPVDRATEMVEIALEEVQRLDTIINNFLRAIRPVPMELEPVSITGVISHSLEVLHAEIANRGVNVEAAWQDEIPPIMGDKVQLEQAFYNLINNAIQAMTDGGRLVITVKVQEPSLVIVIADDGKGIAPEDLSNIFNPYYTTRAKGTGLGLVIVERIVRDHDARLAVDSEVGEGTTFTLTFPLREKRVHLLDFHDDSEASTP